MKPRFLIPLTALVATGLIISCVPAGVPQPSTSASAETTADLSFAKLPILRSSFLEQSWGLPKITVYNHGGYRLAFRQGGTLNFVFIHGLMEAEPTPATVPDWQEDTAGADGMPSQIHHKQDWRTTRILGKPVKWYQNDGGGGADFPTYRTVDFSLAAPDGRIGHYRIEVSTDNPANVPKWIKSMNW